MSSTDARKTYVLVHGGFHGGWCWKQVARQLRELGHDVYTPTWTGLGERAHLVSIRPTLETFITDITQVLHYEDLKDVVLVGHSFAGSVIAAVADRMPERLRHLVYLDAQILQSGQSALDIAPPDLYDFYKKRADETSGGLTIPANDPRYFGISEPDLIAWITPKLTPHPFQTYVDKLRLDHPLGNGLPVTYIACTEPYNRGTTSSRELLKSLEDWTSLEIATGHDAMLTAPEALTAMLAEIG